MELKYLTEQRSENQEKMQKILDTAKLEKRALSEEEIAKFNELKKLIDEIDATIKAEDEARKMDMEENKKENTKEQSQKETESTEKEERAFVDFIVTGEEKRANSPGMSYGSNGAIVPTTIAKKIIEKVEELSPIYEKVEKFHTSGTLEIPVYDVDSDATSPTGDVNVAYQGDEFTSLVAGQGKFTSVELKGYSHGALSVISRKLLNNTDIDITNFLTNKIAQAFAEFWERELLIGTGSTNNHMTGAISTTNLVATGNTTYTAANAAKIDKLIDLQLAVPQQYQKNAIWIMNKAVFTELRKAKDGNGNYYMAYGKGLTGGFDWEFLGKPVYISDNMPAATTVNNIPVLYGDFSGMAMKISQDLEIQLMREKYIDKNAIGIVGWAEC
ncbi:MAG: phage major capsid protein, partial [Clostridia bacterium]|nr:phage major capsid protein [Clostridia bacterium]